MFKIHMKDTLCSLSEEDYAILGQKTEMFSGSDIRNVVKDAIMQPVRSLQDQTHFKEVPGPDPTYTGDGMCACDAVISPG